MTDPSSREQRNADELYALFREGSDAAPGPALDASILETARKDLQAGRTTTASRPPAWWRRWLPASTAIAVAVLGVSVTLRVIDEEDARQSNMLGEPVPLESTRPAAPSAITNESDAMPRSSAAIGKGKEQAKTKKRTVEAPAPARMKSMSADAAKRENAPSAAPPTAAEPAQAASEAVMERQMPSLPADLSEKQANKQSEAPTEPATAKAVPAESETAGDEPATELRDGEAFATPQTWLDHIRAMRAAGREEAATLSLARFRARFPEYKLPDDLAIEQR